MKFPIYRKYNGIDVWFKVLSPKHFIQYKKLGNKLKTYEVEAKIFPEQQFIRDMINLYENRWTEVTEQDFNDFLSKLN